MAPSSPVTRDLYHRPEESDPIFLHFYQCHFLQRKHLAPSNLQKYIPSFYGIVFVPWSQNRFLDLHKIVLPSSRVKLLSSIQKHLISSLHKNLLTSGNLLTCSHQIKIIFVSNLVVTPASLYLVSIIPASLESIFYSLLSSLPLTKACFFTSRKIALRKLTSIMSTRTISFLRVTNV